MTRLKSRILLADDHSMVRRGLRLILDAQPDLDVVAEAADGAEAVQVALATENLDLAILDVSMPRMTGIQAAAELHKRRPQLLLLILTMHENEQYLKAALAAGASGYVVKKVADRDLIDACRATLRGERFLYAGVPGGDVKHQVQRARGGESARDLLTPRETQILKLVAESYTNAQIAEALVISEKTVDSHRAHILEKLALHDRVDLARYAIRIGLVEP